MVGMCSCMWLICASIVLLSLAYINAETEERIREVTVRSLKFLTTYQANVAAHRAGPVDDELKKDFWEAWKDSLFNVEETLTKIYNSVEKDWRYALDLARSDEDNLSALVIAFYIKMEAYVQSLYYMPPAFVMSLYPEHYDSVHCQYLAAKLLILSYIGTDELIKKLLSVAGSSLSAGNLSDIKHYQTLIHLLYTDFRFNLRHKHHRNPEDLENSTGRFRKYLHLLAKNPLLVVIKRLSSRIMFGDVSVTTEGDRHTPYWFDADYWNFIWGKAKYLNKRLTKSSEDYVNYNVTSALHDIISQRSQFGKLSQQDFVNELKEMKLKKLEIRLIKGKFSVNLK